jgi:hypothetical protein
MGALVQNAMLGAKDARRRDNSRVWPEGHVIIPEAPYSLGLSWNFLTQFLLHRWGGGGEGGGGEGGGSSSHI